MIAALVADGLLHLNRDPAPDIAAVSLVVLAESAAQRRQVLLLQSRLDQRARDGDGAGLVR